jgi:hypothetical protein
MLDGGNGGDPLLCTSERAPKEYRMWTKGLALLGLAFGAAIMGSACVAGEPTDDDLDADLSITATEGEEDLADAEDELSGQDLARLPRCGGFAGFRCPGNLRCVDMPGDDCDPNRGGADCLGVCVGARTDARRLGCGNPLRSYVSRDPNRCAAVLFHCAAGSTTFFDRCGCGCLRQPGNPSAGGTRCGNSVCGPREFCCNESCSRCAPIGGACTQEFCG